MAPLQQIKESPKAAFYSLIKGNKLQLQFAKYSRAYNFPILTARDETFKLQNTLLDMWINGLI